MAKKINNELDNLIAAAYKTLTSTIEVKSAFKCKSATETGDGVQAFVNVSPFGQRNIGFRIYRKDGEEMVFPASTKNGDKYYDNHRKDSEATDVACKAVALDHYKKELA